MINRNPSPSKLQSSTNSTNESNQLQSQPENIQYFNQVLDNQPKSGYANQANQASQLVTNPNDPFILNPTIKVPFANRPDIKEQLQTYLPLKCSLAKLIEDKEKQIFSLIDKINEFLANPNTALLLILADGGAGKSLFVQSLVTNILEQKAPYDQIKAPNGKPYFPLYLMLSNIKNPHKIFEEGLNLTQASIHELQKTYQVLLIMDGFDEQSYQWKNLYSENQLYNYPGLKVVVTSRINALPNVYSEYFVARQQDGKDLGYQELYLKPFQADQIDIYVASYVTHNKANIEEQVAQNQLPKQWLDSKHVQSQINNIPGLKELMQTPLLCRLVIIALPQLSQNVNQSETSYKIIRAQVYEAFMRQWVITQMITKQHKSLDQITDEKINQVLAFGEKMALAMYQDNCSAQLNVGVATLSFNSAAGEYQQEPSKYSWFEQAKDMRTLLPIQELQAGVYKFVHLSMQEYLLASFLANELIQSDNLTNLTINQFKLTLEVRDRPILYFLGDMATSSTQFADKLFELIYQTKTDKSQGVAGANAISVLNVSSVLLAYCDLSNTYLPNADLSGSVLWHTNFSNANLSNINLQGSKLNNSNFTKSNLAGLSLGRYPMFRLKHSTSALCYSPDGRYLAISQANEMILFDVLTRKEIREFTGHTDKISSVSFSSDGRLIATASSDKTVRIYVVQSGECLHVLSDHTEEIRSVSFSQDNSLLATGSDDKTVRIYMVKSGECLVVLRDHTSGINSVSFSPNGRLIATGSSDGTVRIYVVKSGGCLKVLSDHVDKVNSVSFSLHGKLLATGSDDATVRIYTVENWDILPLPPSDGNSVRNYTTACWDCLKVLSVDIGGIKYVNFSPDGRLVATGGWDGTVRIYAVRSGECLNVSRDHTNSIHSVSFSPDSMLVATGSQSNIVRIYAVENMEYLKALTDHTKNIQSVSVSHDGRLVVTGSTDCTARIYLVESGECLRVLNGHTNIVFSVNISSDGRLVVTGSWDNTARIYLVENGECLCVLSGHTDLISCVSFSSNGSLIATGSMDNTVRIYAVKSGKCLKILSGHSSYIWCVSFSSDGRLIATGSYDKMVRIYAVDSGECLQVLVGHNLLIVSVSFSSDGSKLFTNDWEGTEKIWSVSSGEELTSEKLPLLSRSTRTVDGLSASYEKRKVILTQSIAVFNSTQPQIEEVSLDFSGLIMNMSLHKSNLGDKLILAVVMREGVIFYSKGINAPLNEFVAFKVNMANQVLDVSAMNLSGSVGLNQSNYDLLEQLGATGTPSEIIQN